ncbi:hypothetical protein [Martelella sp. AMO21009]
MHDAKIREIRITESFFFTEEPGWLANGMAYWLAGYFPAAAGVGLSAIKHDYNCQDKLPGF